jgi:hypothetical protein
MPIVTNLQTSLVRDANAILATTFFPRWRGGFWQELAGSYVSTALVEPFALDGAAPMLQYWQGSMNARGVSSWTLQVPNLLFKTIEEISRTSLEMDQTGTVLRRVAQMGVRLAQLPDFLMAKRILTASLSSSASIVFGGQTYYTTFENTVPFFSTAHTTYAASNQSNIIQGGLPSTISAIGSNDIAVLANQMQKDIEQVVAQIATIVDDKGIQVFPSLDPEKHLVVVVPPILKQAARLAFSTPAATIGGTNGTGGSAGATTSIGPTMVKRVVSSPLLAGCIDVESTSPTGTVSPVHQTDYYIFIEDDLVKPFYFQRFRPKHVGEYSPIGYNPQAAAQAAIAAAEKAGVNITAEAADVYASAEVDHNLGALGANAQLSVVTQESFFMSPRMRGNITFGPWFCGYRVDPTGYST